MNSVWSSTTSARRRWRTRGSRCTTPRRPIARRSPTSRNTSTRWTKKITGSTRGKSWTWRRRWRIKSASYSPPPRRARGYSWISSRHRTMSSRRPRVSARVCSRSGRSVDGRTRGWRRRDSKKSRRRRRNERGSWPSNASGRRGRSGSRSFRLRTPRRPRATPARTRTRTRQVPLRTRTLTLLTLTPLATRRTRPRDASRRPSWRAKDGGHGAAAA
mmetsp:Transcript_7669/g.34223  ORF Transcript_7669/g.34223 Transcript_7669/m.34223 type:complete len:216 (-) Transcript_7669:118-765(-)